MRQGQQKGVSAHLILPLRVIKLGQTPWEQMPKVKDVHRAREEGEENY